MSVEKITKMYDELYKKKQAELEKAKNQSLINLEEEKTSGEKTYYDDRNKAYTQNVQNTQAIRDYMAKNNLLQSGENVDALLRSTSDLSNNVGKINDNERTFNNSINNRRTNLNNDYLSSLASAKADYEAQKQKDIMAYEEQLRQEALARSSYSSGGGGSSSYSSGITATDAKNAMSALVSDFNTYIKNGDTRNARDTLFQGLRAYQNGLITAQTYADMQNTLTALENEKAKAETETKKKSGQTLQYGYRNGVAGYY